MRAAGESLKEIVSDYKKLAALEVTEAALSTNKPYVTAQAGKTGKRGPSDHIPIEGRHPETAKSRVTKKLDAMCSVIKQTRLVAEDEYDFGSLPKRRSHPEWEARRKAVLDEQNVSPVELAFLYGYSSDKQVRELRIRHGLSEHTGYPLKDDERPIVSTSRRVRR